MQREPMKAAKRLARKTGMHPWDAQQQILFTLSNPRRAMAGALIAAAGYRNAPDPKFRATARHMVKHCKEIRLGTSWSISTPRPLPA